MVVGLYIDGWAHDANKPETFFTPWHAVLYSGFFAAIAYSAVAGIRRRRAGLEASVGDDRVATLGLVLFAASGVGDMLWHEVVGVEADLEALVSPTHLLLMIGGLLMVTLPIRAVAGDRRQRLAVLLSVGLALAVVMFFLMYLSPWAEPNSFRDAYVPDDDIAALKLQTGMATILVTTTLLSGAVLWAARRFTLPRGTATVMFTAVAVAQAGLEGFDLRFTILAATAAGLVADGLLAAGRSLPLVGAGTGLALAGSYFALLHAESQVGWGPSLWVGAIVFAGLTGYAVGLACMPTTRR